MIIQLTMCVNVKWVFTKVIRICFMFFHRRKNREDDKDEEKVREKYDLMFLCLGKNALSF